jgi:acetyl esterase/lipase
MLIQAGNAEVVMDDSIRFYQKGVKAGNHVELELYRDMFHVFQTFPFLKESAIALNRIGLFVKSFEKRHSTISNSAILIDQKNNQKPLVFE